MHRNRNPDHAAWRGDSIQIGIDSHNDADGRNSYGSDDTEFTFALNKKPWEPSRPADPPDSGRKPPRPAVHHPF